MLISKRKRNGGMGNIESINGSGGNNRKQHRQKMKYQYQWRNAGVAAWRSVAAGVVCHRGHGAKSGAYQRKHQHGSSISAASENKAWRMAASNGEIISSSRHQASE